MASALGQQCNLRGGEKLELPHQTIPAGAATCTAGTLSHRIAVQAQRVVHLQHLVLPFAYVQSLFASGDYQRAASVLREAMTNVSPEQEGVFYPRGLYSDENVLRAQIKQLEDMVVQNPLNADFELLLGYQLLGMSRFDEAGGYLHHAQLDQTNRQAATVLLSVLEKLGKTDTGGARPESATSSEVP